ncbi:Uncharacterised protein [Bordetella pertussis]|nr:Uncharacterised protein [Bordetella pertussis]CFO77500.1 Uncharacterised protein [Bordetella pertussis]CPI44998.1 Uncharacterised protein [Bordetella pertussis]CPL82989.1 Uncharacterised protein [Bordetella pertussis]CPM24294.1 Uncharacterised protein [Bordetella pertussis]
MCWLLPRLPSAIMTAGPCCLAMSTKSAIVSPGKFLFATNRFGEEEQYRMGVKSRSASKLMLLNRVGLMPCVAELLKRIV